MILTTQMMPNPRERLRDQWRANWLGGPRQSDDERDEAYSRCRNDANAAATSNRAARFEQNFRGWRAFSFMCLSRGGPWSFWLGS